MYVRGYIAWSWNTTLIMWIFNQDDIQLQIQVPPHSNFKTSVQIKYNKEHFFPMWGKKFYLYRNGVPQYVLAVFTDIFSSDASIYRIIIFVWKYLDQYIHARVFSQNFWWGKLCFWGRFLVPVRDGGRWGDSHRGQSQIGGVSLGMESDEEGLWKTALKPKMPPLQQN